MARDFDGTDDKIEIGTTQSYFNFMHDTSAKFTLSIWYKLNAIEPDAFKWFLGDQGGSSAQIGIEIRFEDRSAASRDHHLICTIANGSGGGNLVAQLISGAVYIPKDTNYHHLCVSYDQSLGSDNFTAFMDGANEINATKEVNAPTDSDSTFVQSLGEINGTGDFDGDEAEVVIWNDILTDNQIVALSNGVNPFGIGNQSNLKYYTALWGNQTPEPNYLQQLHNGIVTGATRTNHSHTEMMENYL